MLKQLTIAASPYHKNKPRNKNLGEKKMKILYRDNFYYY